jgi:hypothetical protein
MGEYQTPVSVRDAITAGMRRPDYSGIRVPVLAFFPLPAPLKTRSNAIGPRPQMNAPPWSKSIPRTSPGRINRGSTVVNRFRLVGYPEAIHPDVWSP